MAVSNRVGWARSDALSAKDATVVVDVVILGIALSAADALFGRVLCSFNIDAIGRAVSGAQEAGHALFQAIFIALQNVHTAVPLLYLCPAERARTIRIILHNRGLEHLPERDAHSLGNCSNVLADRHTSLV